MSGEKAIGWIREVVLDCPDPWVLARFWASLFGGIPVEWYPGWVTIEPPPHGQRLSFQATATPLAQDVARVHFDILVEDLTKAHARVVSAGHGGSIATRSATRSASSSVDAPVH
jgi:hypothetical protein